jgi:Aspartic acid proteinase inhibitor
MNKSYVVAIGFLLLGTTLAQIAGGYGRADVKDPQVIAAAKFALQAKNTSQKRTGNQAYSLLEISKAEIQVVAGLNFHVCLKTKLGNKQPEVVAVVYQNLQQEFSLSSFSWKKCGIK